jgi:hypothetical protein
MFDAYDTDGDGMMNGYTDAAAAPYNNNRLRDEFNRPSPGLTVAGLVNHTFQLSGKIPAGAPWAIISIEGIVDSSTETLRLQNIHFIEKGANPNEDGDGDGVTDGDEDLMGTDKYDPTSVLRLTETPGVPGQFTFTGVNGRFYRTYVSDDAAEPTHLTKWLDAGLGTKQDLGPHTVDVTPASGESRRYYRVHVMQSDGPWPASVP